MAPTRRSSARWLQWCAGIDARRGPENAKKRDRDNPIPFGMIAAAVTATALGGPPARGAAFPVPAFQCAILCAAGIVNDELLRICLKTAGIQLFEAEFDINLFVFGKLDSLDQAEQKLPIRNSR